MIEILEDGSIKFIKQVTVEGDTILDFRTKLPLDTTFIMCVYYDDYTYVNQLIYMETKDNFNYFKSRLEVNEEMINASDISLKVSTVIGSEDSLSDPLKLKMDSKKAMVNFVPKNPLERVYSDLADLRRMFLDYTKGFVNPTIKKFDKSLVKKGMIYTAIDDNGNCAFTYPFINAINQINEKKAIGKKINLNAEDIPLKSGKNLEVAVQELVKTIRAQQEIINNLVEVNQSLTEDMADVKIKVQEFTNTDII